MGHRLMREGKPSPALIISVIALVFAVGGGYAVAKKGGDKKSDKKIANKVVTKRAKGLSVMHAKSADSATGLAGLTRWRTSIATPGASSASPNTVTLATAGPFTVLGECYISGSNTDAGTYIQTSQDGSYAQGYSGNDYVPLNVSDGAVQISEDIASGTTATHTAAFKGPDDGSWVATSPDGSLSLDGFGTQGVYLQGAGGPACSFSGFLLTE